MLKVAVKEGRHAPGLEAELAARIAAGSLLARDAYPVLLAPGPEWEASRAALIGWLASRPEHAVTLAAIHAVNLGMSALLWEEGPAGTVQEPRFSVRSGITEDGVTTWSATRVAQWKGGARQQAALSLVAGLAGQPDPSVSDPGPAVAPGQSPQAAGHSPVMALYELQQAGVLCDLDWVPDRSGPQHVPVFTCTATARHAASGQSLTADATAKTKKDAKAAAAQRLLDAVTAIPLASCNGAP